MKAKSYLVLAMVYVLLVPGHVLAQDVAIFFDANLPVLGVNNGAGFATLLVDELKKKNVSAEIVDSKALLEYMNANPTGIMLVCQGIMPGTIFANQGKDDPIYDWLRGGGIGGFVGDYPFYYWDNTNNVAAGGGQQKVFGVQVTNGNVVTVTPTDLGLQYMPSLKKWTSNRPVGIPTLQQNKFEFESYADNGTDADPIAYRSADMQGWFINFHTSCCGTNVPPNEQMAVEYAELISNRFVDRSQSVKQEGKLSVLWGQLKHE